MIELKLNYRSKSPLSKQIVSQIRRKIVFGELAPRTSLPSIRELSKAINISVGTVKSAYNELARDELIYVVPGKGYVVNDDCLKVCQKNAEQIRAKIVELSTLLKANGFTKEDIANIVDEAWI